jgi:hypothetical protein
MENLRFPNRKTSMENTPQNIEPPATNEPFKMTQETAQSIKILIDSVAPYVERHMEGTRDAMIKDRTLTIDAARQEREAAYNASDASAKRIFYLLTFIVGTTAATAIGFAFCGQWGIAEKVAIGMLSFAMGARVSAR